MIKKSLVTIQIVDLFGSPIPKAQYEVKNQRSGQLLAKGATNSKGCIVEISRDKGTVLDIYIKSMFNNLMIKVQTFTLSRERMIVKIASPKALLDLKTLDNKGGSGKYKRKTHIVKNGENLTEIAKKNQTTVIALVRLNNLKNPDKLTIGQVLKLPINLPESGSNAHYDKNKASGRSTNADKTKPPESQATASKNPPSKDPKAKPDVKPFSDTILDKADQSIDEAKRALDQAYEEGKKALLDGVGALGKIFTTNDRSEDGGTPKADAPNLCKTNPQCISSGKSELIREVNIRLAGFGGALPTDEFTELTAKCIKQFQRDYMGTPETGKICGTVLAALDKFRDEYGISAYFESMKCPCKKCSGFGNGRSGNFSFPTKKGIVNREAIEYPGMHRSLIWGLKAMLFYFKKMPNPEGYRIASISSGYRCVERNFQKKRPTTNHMGNALDLTIIDNKGNAIIVPNLENIIRIKWFCKYLNTSLGWSKNHFGLERTSDGASSWVHLDVREFDTVSYKSNKFYAKTVDELNGIYLKNIVETAKLKKLMSCSGDNSMLIEKPNQEITGKTIGGIIGKVIASHESNGSYTIFNRGTVGQYAWTSGNEDISQRTINEWIGLGDLSGNNEKKRFAMGKYQIIPNTLKAAKKGLGLDGSEKITNELQEIIFKDYFIKMERKQIYTAIVSGTNSAVESAGMHIAQVWASVGVPKDTSRKTTKKDKHGKEVVTYIAIKKDQSYWSGVGGNKAHTPSEAVSSALIRMHKDYKELRDRGKTESEAFDLVMATDKPIF